MKLRLLCVAVFLAACGVPVSAQVRQRHPATSVRGPSPGRPPGVFETVFVLPNDLRTGNCHMQNAVLVLRSDGTGHFQAQTRTDFTRSKDIWHLAFALIDNAGNVLSTVQMRDSPPMDSPNAVPASFYYSYAYDFAFDHNFFNILSFVDSISSC